MMRVMKVRLFDYPQDFPWCDEARDTLNRMRSGIGVDEDGFWSAFADAVDELFDGRVVDWDDLQCLVLVDYSELSEVISRKVCE